MAADISLLCKCSFPHKQRGVQNGRVERVESIVCVCACLCVSSINSSPSLGQSAMYVCIARLVLTVSQLPETPSVSRQNKLDCSQLTLSLLNTFTSTVYKHQRRNAWARPRQTVWMRYCKMKVKWKSQNKWTITVYKVTTVPPKSFHPCQNTNIMDSSTQRLC